MTARDDLRAKALATRTAALTGNVNWAIWGPYVEAASPHLILALLDEIDGVHLRCDDAERTMTEWRERAEKLEKALQRIADETAATWVSDLARAVLAEVEGKS